MKVLSIPGLNAWAVMAGHQRFWRAWNATDYRGPIAVHAAARASRGETWTRSMLSRRLGITHTPIQPPRGEILGLVNLVDVLAINVDNERHFQPGVFDEHGAAGDPFAQGPLCLVFDKPRPFERPYVASAKSTLLEWARQHSTFEIEDWIFE